MSVKMTPAFLLREKKKHSQRNRHKKINPAKRQDLFQKHS